MATIFDSYMAQQDPANNGAIAFKSDVSQRRQLVPSAHKKPKKSGCSLPSDYLTSSQVKKLNGPVENYNLSRPMSLREFDSLPEDIKKEYLEKLIHSMGVTTKYVGNMFGCCLNNVRNIMIRLGVKTHGKSYRMTPEQKKAWENFIGDFSPEISKNKSSKTTKREESTATVVVEEKTKPKFHFSNLSISVHASSWKEIAEILKDLECPLPEEVKIIIEQ